MGEIDIVAADRSAAGGTLVFCEVKCRSGLGFGHPLEAITYAKLRTLRQLAAHWMREHQVTARFIRLDAIGVVLRPGAGAVADPRAGRWAEMASACAWSVALSGLEGRMVEVEADIGAGLPRTVLVGLPDSALYQSRDRCKAAVSNSGQEWPISLLTINLPGDPAQGRQPLRPGHRRGRTGGAGTCCRAPS